MTESEAKARACENCELKDICRLRREVLKLRQTPCFGLAFQSWHLAQGVYMQIQEKIGFECAYYKGYSE